MCISDEKYESLVISHDIDVKLWAAQKTPQMSQGAGGEDEDELLMILAWWDGPWHWMWRWRWMDGGGSRDFALKVAERRTDLKFACNNMIGSFNHSTVSSRGRVGVQVRNVCWTRESKNSRNLKHSLSGDFLPSCVDDLPPPQPRLVCAGRVCAAERCVFPVCAAPRRSARTPAELRWRGRRRRPRMSTPRRLDRQSCTWCLLGWLMQREENANLLFNPLRLFKSFC